MRRLGSPSFPWPVRFGSALRASDYHEAGSQDALFVDGAGLCAGVFDGVSGSPAGQAAARLASRDCQKHAAALPKRFADANAADAAVSRVLRHAHEEILRHAARKPAERAHMATTVVLAALREVDRVPSLLFGHAGDSRIYRRRATGGLERLTADDGLLTFRVLTGVLSADDALRIDQATDIDSLSDAERQVFGLRGMIWQCLGQSGPLTPHTGVAALSRGDRLLLCSDGVHDNLTDSEIESILAASENPQRAADALLRVSAGVAFGGEAFRAKPDDISLVVVDIG